MPALPVTLVTVSREYGAGGSEFAHALGERLGWPVLDREIVYQVAERLEFDAALVALLDEHPPTRLSRLAAALFVVPPEAPTYVPPHEALPPDAVAEAVRQVIAEAVARAPLVVVGHGAQCRYHGRPGTLHVRLVAPLATRARRLQARLGCDGAAAASAAARVDADRGRYIQRHYRHDWRDPLLYDVQLNTAHLAAAEAAAVVAGLVTSGRGAGGA